MPAFDNTQPNGNLPLLIRNLVESFYSRVRADRALGTVFNRRLTTEAEWQTHLNTMTRFWESLLLGTRSYRGRTVSAHQVIGPLPEELFERWHVLFDYTVDETFDPCEASRIKRLALKAGRSIYLRTRDNVPASSKGVAEWPPA